MAARKNTLSNFWSKVHDDGPLLVHVAHLGRCWMWTAGRFTRGYGAFSLGGKLRKAHRVMWEITYGVIPSGLLVCHRCDNPSCVNPDHLFIDTPSGNNRDMIVKGRHRCGRGERHSSKTRPDTVTRGEAAGLAKLTEADVRVIRQRRANGERVSRIAADYPVSLSTISLICLRQRWAHVP